MGEKNYLIGSKKKPGVLEIETTKSVGSQLCIAHASHKAKRSGVFFAA